MDFESYREQAHTTSKETKIFGSKIIYPILGLADESGEVLGKVKKRFRDTVNPVISDEDLLKDPEFITMINKELGDVLWYIAECCSVLNINMNSLAQGNLDKLFSRKVRGVISGSGDVR